MCEVKERSELWGLVIYMDEEGNYYYKVSDENLFIHRKFAVSDKVLFPLDGELIKYDDYVLLIPSETKRIHSFPLLSGFKVLHPEEYKALPLSYKAVVLVEVEKEKNILFEGTFGGKTTSEKFVRLCTGETYKYIPLPRDVRKILL